MRRVAAIAVCALAAVTTSSSVQGRQENQPGRPTAARMYIANSAAEAVPVVVHSSSDVIPVTMVGAPQVTLSSATVVTVRMVRQNWEYRQVSVPAGQDVATLLNAAGNDGWEALTVSAAGGGTNVVLKRPR